MTSEAVLVAVEQAAPVSDRPTRTVRALCEHPLLDATWSRYDAGEHGPDPHVHHEHVDAFYVVEGELQFRVGPELEVGPGTGGHVRRRPAEHGAHVRQRERRDGPLAELTGHGSSPTARRDGTATRASGGLGTAGVTIATAGRDGELGSEPQFEAMELTVDADFDVAPHAHDDQVNAFFMVAGEVEFAVGDRYERAGPGTWLTAPPDAQHGLRGAGPAAARVLFVRAPAS